MTLTRQALLSQVEIIRAGAEIFCVDTAMLLRKTGETIDEFGTVIPQYAAPVETPCRVINRSGDARLNTTPYNATRLIAYDTAFMVQLPFSTEVHHGDFLEHTDPVTSTVRKLEIVFVPERHIMMGAFIVGCDEVL